MARNRRRSVAWGWANCTSRCGHWKCSTEDKRYLKFQSHHLHFHCVLVAFAIYTRINESKHNRLSLQPYHFYFNPNRDRGKNNFFYFRIWNPVFFCCIILVQITFWNCWTEKKVCDCLQKAVYFHVSFRSGEFEKKTKTNVARHSRISLSNCAARQAKFVIY